MKNIVYVLTLEGEPQYVTKNITEIEKECRKWYDDHYDNWSIQQDYQYWLEDRPWYPNTDEGTRVGRLCLRAFQRWRVGRLCVV